MSSAWRNFKNIFSRPLFTIIFWPKMIKFHPYSRWTGEGYHLWKDDSNFKLPIKVVYYLKIIFMCKFNEFKSYFHWSRRIKCLIFFWRNLELPAIVALAPITWIPRALNPRENRYVRLSFFKLIPRFYSCPKNNLT